MALNETPNKRQYTTYKRHVNESHERVNAETVNTLQKDINSAQLEDNSIKDKLFEERVYTIFNNNNYANAMFIDYFKDGEYINLTDSKNITIVDNLNQLSLKYKNQDGEMKSQIIISAYGSQIELNDFFLIVNEVIPVGARAQYFLETEKGERWNIKPITEATNKTALPLHLTENIKEGFRVIADFYPNAQNESPVLNGYAVLYWDAQVEKNYSLTNPDLMRFP